MNISDAIAALEQYIPNPSKGLPEEVFLFMSRITPLVNVDLLIKNENGDTLLSWRDDQYCGKGWHLPGGIIRFRETLETRVKKVAQTEIGVDINFDPVPLAINQLIHPELDSRGHFISILYKCNLSGSFVPQNKGLFQNDKGYLMWHNSCPQNLIKYHQIYRQYI